MQSHGYSSDGSWLELLAFDLDLQLVKFDPTANAPERDNATEAPEFCSSVEAPQTAYIEAPEVAFERSGLIANTPDTVNAIEVDISGDYVTAQTTSGIPRKIFWISFFIFCACCIAIAIGVGVGVGTINHATQTSISITPLKGILDGSSLAVVSTPAGNRHIFFQDRDGNLRETEYRPASSSWIASASSIIAADARNGTPLSACMIPNLYDDPTAIYLFYVFANNTLAMISFDSGIGWVPQTSSMVEFSNMTKFTAAKESRSLSITILPNTVTTEACLLFEGENHNITAMRGRYVFNRSNDSTYGPSIRDFWVWEDLTDSLMPRFPSGAQYLPNATLGAPFTDLLLAGGPCMTRTNNNSYGLNGFESPSVILAYRNSEIVRLVYSCYSNGSFSTEPGFFDGIPFAQNDNFDESQIHPIVNSDIIRIMYGPIFWVNGTSICIDNINNFMDTFPTSPFPYTRLATTNSTDGSTIYLYHQINATIIAEDVWDATASVWSSNNITISVT